MTRRSGRSGAEGHRGGGGQDRWLVSYADFITLLFAFFTMMYAVSTVDAGKMGPAVSSIHEAFSLPSTTTTPGPAAVPSAPLVPPVRVTMPPPNDLDEVRRKLASELSDAVDTGRLEITSDLRGLVLSLPVEATFAIGSADVRAEARLLIGRIASTLGPLANPVRIEGHTDDVPISTPRFGSNWELSTARASAVVEFLIETADMVPSRLSAAGYGEFHPRASNDSAASRARNRRVDIVVLNSAASRQEPSVEGETR
jgi:chemotaxis protein MotB